MRLCQCRTAFEVRTRVVTFYTAKHFIIPIETLFKHLPFLGLSQFKNFKRTEFRIEQGLSVPKIISERCDW